jgi:hypothetical protein
MITWNRSGGQIGDYRIPMIYVMDMQSSEDTTKKGTRISDIQYTLLHLLTA